jgi:hypothetical protein
VTTQLDPNAIPDLDQKREELGRELRQRAKEALKRGEFISAMLHASDALMLFPNDRTYLDLVDHIAQESSDPLSTVPVATGAVHVATAAVRARLLMTQRKLDEAVKLLSRVVEVAPHIAYFEWLARWLQPHVIADLGWPLLSGSLLRVALRVGTRLPAARAYRCRPIPKIDASPTCAPRSPASRPCANTSTSPSCTQAKPCCGGVWATRKPR